MKEFQTLKSKESVTKSGRTVRLYANIGGISDLQAVMQRESGFSEVNSFIWRRGIILPRTSSSRYISL